MRLLTDRAIAIDTARGSPSGIATIINTIETIADSEIFKSVLLENKPALSSNPKNARANVNNINDKKHAIVAIITYFSIYFDSFSNFSSKKVFYSSSFSSPYFLYLASIVFSPTAQMIALPCPAITLESANKNGSG